jgi:hypothetical protein
VRPADDAVEHVGGGERVVTALEHVVDGQVRQAPHRRVRARPCRAPPTQDSNDDHRRHERGAGDVHGAAAARRQHGLVQRLWQLNKRGISHNEAAAPRMQAARGSIPNRCCSDLVSYLTLAAVLPGGGFNKWLSLSLSMLWDRACVCPIEPWECDV